MIGDIVGETVALMTGLTVGEIVALMTGRTVGDTVALITGPTVAEIIGVKGNIVGLKVGRIIVITVKLSPNRALSAKP